MVSQLNLVLVIGLLGWSSRVEVEVASRRLGSVPFGQLQLQHSLVPEGAEKGEGLQLESAS